MNTYGQTTSELLHDPNRHTVSIGVAADILGIGRTTAYYAVAHTGELVAGVPALSIATGSTRQRLVVSTSHLRKVLGIADPT